MTATRKQKYEYEIRKRREVLIWKLSSGGCAVCGEKDPDVLDLDHLDRATKNPLLKSTRVKTFAPNRSMSRLGWAALHAELRKCQVLCANCHRRKTAREREA